MVNHQCEGGLSECRAICVEGDRVGILGTQFVVLVVLVAVISVENLRTLSVNLTADKEEFEARRFSIAVGVELVCIRSAAPIFIVVTEIKRIFSKRPVLSPSNRRREMIREGSTGIATMSILSQTRAWT